MFVYEEDRVLSAATQLVNRPYTQVSKLSNTLG